MRGRANRALLDSDTVRSGTVGDGGQVHGCLWRRVPLHGQPRARAPQDHGVAHRGGHLDAGSSSPSRPATESLHRRIDAPYVRLALQRWLQAAFLGVQDEVGALSPDVFWVRKQKWIQATSSTGWKPRVLRGTGLREALASF